VKHGRCQLWQKMKILGAEITRCGCTEVAVAANLARAEKAVGANHKILFARGASKIKRLVEFVRRVIPVALHCCGGWAMNQKIAKMLWRWESRVIGRIWGTRRKPEEKDADYSLFGGAQPV